VDLAVIQPIPSVGHEDVGGDRPSCPPTCASREVICEHVAGRRMQGQQASLAEFAASDCQRRAPEIDVLEFEVACFSEAQARDAQEAEQTMVGPGPQSAVTGQPERRSQQASDLSVRVEVGSRPLWPVGQ